MPIAQLIMFSDTSCPSFSRDLSNNCVDEKDAVSAYDARFGAVPLANLLSVKKC